MGHSSRDSQDELRKVLEEVLDQKLNAAVCLLRAELREFKEDAQKAQRQQDSVPEDCCSNNSPTRRSIQEVNGVPPDEALNGGDLKDYMQVKDIENQYENLYEVTRAFNLLCEDGTNAITAQDLVKMKAGHLQVPLTNPKIQEMIPRFTRAIEAINSKHDLGISSRTTFLDQRDLSLDAFAVIMHRRDDLTGFDEDIQDAIDTIRETLLKEETFRKVAIATNTSASALQAFDRYKSLNSTGSKCLQYLDPFIGVVILLNAIVVLISTDVARGSEVWVWLEVIFGAIFLAELAFKIIVHGPLVFFLGHDMCWNIFDTIVVLLATVDVIFTHLNITSVAGDFTLIRLLRFARLTKLVRVLKLKAFAELVMLVNGVLVGFRTLVWVVIFWIFLLLSLGVVLTEVVGRESKTTLSPWCLYGAEGTDKLACEASAVHLDRVRRTLFGNTFRSMFTVFRCLTEGCSSVDGTPLVPYFLHSHGPGFIIMYMLVFVFVTFGLFNLVMAVFVENTISGAKRADVRRKEAQWNEHIKTARKLQELIVLFCRGDKNLTPLNSKKSRHPMVEWFWENFSTRHAVQADAEEIKDINVSQEAFYHICESADGKRLLQDLDIDFHSRRVIFDVLDANGNGHLEVTELVQGLLRLRGVGDRSDMVASLLGIRAMQRSLKALEVLGLHQQENMQQLMMRQRARTQSLDVLP